MKNILLPIILALIVSCSGIEAINNNPATADLVIKVATTQYISAEEDPVKRIERAKAVKEKTQGFLKRIEGNPELSLDQLENDFRREINWVDMDIADQVLADVLIENVKLKLEEAVEDARIPEDYVVGARTLLNLVIKSAGLYGV